jgi:hypothetical protein
MANVETTLKGIRTIGASTDLTHAQKKALQQGLLRDMDQAEAFLCVECKTAYPHHTYACCLRRDDKEL